MCGIAGFVGNYSIDLLRAMSHKIAHRGPDDDGVYFEQESSLGLAHRRLSIIDLSSAAHQPMWNLSRTAAIIFNGEIYNYRELRQECTARGYVFTSSSDTEVLLALYQLYGMDYVTRLNGIFAFALWDAQERLLFIARDGAGVKPLYYSRTDRGFVFASELKAIAIVPGLNKSIDVAALHSYLTYLWCPAPRTLMQSIKKLQPGNALVIKNGTITKQWQFYDFPTAKARATPLAVGNVAEQTRKLLEQAVTRQMVADVPVGTFLSGGLDSSAITAFARRSAKKHQLECFTIELPAESLRQEGLTDDLPYAKQVARHLDVHLNVVSVDPSIAARLPFMVYHQDEPQADMAAINLFYISELAQKNNIKVLLSGAGGDDVFTGYRRHYALLQERYWSFLPHGVRQALTMASSVLPPNIRQLRRIKKAFAYAGLAQNQRIAGYFHWADNSTLCKLYSRDFYDRVSAFSFSAPLMDSLERVSSNATVLQKMLYLDQKHFLADHNLNYTDKLGMAAGVEIRVPFLDPDLMAFAAGLPDSFKQHGTQGKWILKKAMEGILPAEVIYRPKSGFVVPIRRWLKNELKEMVADVLSESSVRNRGIFNHVAVSYLIRNDADGKIDAAYTILSLICIELWCRMFIDADARLLSF